MKKKNILITFVGGSDPTRNDYDGPILQIVRHYKPDEIVLLYSESFYDDENRRDTVKKHLNHMSRALEFDLKIAEYVVRSQRKINDYDIIEDIYKLLNEITPNYENGKFLINITSGTPQLTAGILIYAKFNINSQDLKLLQVSTPTKTQNLSTPKLEDDPNNNLDYLEETEKRVAEVQFDLFFAAINKNVLLELIQTYQYDKVQSLLKMINYKNPKIDEQLKLAQNYINLNNEIVQNHYNATHLDLYSYYFIRYFNVIYIKFELEDYRNFFIMSSVLIFELTFKNIKPHFKNLKRRDPHSGMIYDESDPHNSLYQRELNDYMRKSTLDKKIKDLTLKLTKEITPIRNDYAHNFIVKFNKSRKQVKQILNKLQNLLKLSINGIKESDFKIIEDINNKIIEELN